MVRHGNARLRVFSGGAEGNPDGGRSGAGGELGSGGSGGSPCGGDGASDCALCEEAKEVEGSVEVRSLEQLDALRGVTAILGGLYITGQENMSAPPKPLMIPTLEALRCLRSVSGEFALRYVEGPKSLDELQSLENVGALSITSTTLADLERLAHLEKLGALWIQRNSSRV
ncbi:MAG: hypothetical protein B6A08_10030 [Sorangiineae bacterium NIC37A_2]|nr:MAG: hypothetical protein B6A08_10030 [Sorangiineae bacterium NIC37A_2]